MTKGSARQHPADPGARVATHEDRELHRLLVEGVRDYAIFMLDPTGHIATWNEGAERIKQYTRDEIVGRHFSTFYPKADIDAHKPERELEIAKATGKFEEEGWRIRKDGSRFWANVLITSIYDSTGELVGFAKVTRDLTERRAAEARALDDARRVAAEEAARREAEVRAHELRTLAEQLRYRTAELEEQSRQAHEARTRADDANRVKSEFLAAMSHELRTPLNAIGGYTDLLMMELSGPLTPQQHDQLTRIKRSQEHLLGIINDILNFSRIEAGQIVYEFGLVSVIDVAESVMFMIAPQAQAKGLTFERDDTHRGVTVWADKAKLEQVVLNLVSNAVKFTSAGGTVSVDCQSIGDAKVGLSVRDTGTGIPNDQLDAIFEPFVQVGRSLSSNREGTGLGLAISRDLARGMHGDIRVESTLGVGSTFTLILPTHPPKKLG